MAGTNTFTPLTKDIDSSSEVLSPTTGGFASDYLGYGSFSGADTKVVVHIPKSQVMQKELRRSEDEARRNLKNAEDYAKRLALASSTTEAELSGAIDDVNFLSDQLATAEENTKSVDDIPSTIVLGEIQTISWSTHREKSPVRVLGSVYPRSFTRGPRSIGGSMVFTVFHKHALHEILEANFKHYSTGTSDYDKQQYSSMLIDQLPALDVSLVFANEYGAVSHMGIYGIDFMQEGGTHSIEDIFSETVVQYVARDMDPMTNVQTAVRTPKGLTNEWTTTATSLMASEEDLYGHIKRRNPFI